MEKNNVSDVMETTMQRMREMVDVNTVVGESITTPDGVTLIPVSRVSFGFGSGGSDFPAKDSSGFGGGGGAGAKIEPVGFIVIKDSNVRMVNIQPPANTSVDRLLELVPDVLDRVQDFIDKNKKED